MGLIKTVTEKPWERKGVIGGMRPEGAFDTESERVALVYFLVIASVVFSLFLVSYYIRMELPDWEPLSEPGQLWFNTGLLVLSSVLPMGTEYRGQGRKAKPVHGFFWRRCIRDSFHRWPVGDMGESAGWWLLHDFQSCQRVLLPDDRTARASPSGWPVGLEQELNSLAVR